MRAWLASVQNEDNLVSKITGIFAGESEKQN